MFPTYASACSDAVHYASACACIGVTGSVTTVAAPVTTVTVPATYSPNTVTVLKTEATQTTTDIAATSTFTTTAATATTTEITYFDGTGPFKLEVTLDDNDDQYLGNYVSLYYYDGFTLGPLFVSAGEDTATIFFFDTSGVLRLVEDPTIAIGVPIPEDPFFADWVAYNAPLQALFELADLVCTIAAGSYEFDCNEGSSYSLCLHVDTADVSYASDEYIGSGSCARAILTAVPV